MLATKQLSAPCISGALFSLFILAGCSQTTDGLSVAGLPDAITLTSTKARAYSYTARDKACMERAMFFESRRSSREGMIGVGTVVMNRLRSGKHGNSICGVVGEKGQFAPGVMTRRMNSKAMPDVEEAAVAVLKGERHPKIKNAMFFHTAGLKFPYKNMHYVAVAGGNAFYEKRGRRWKPLPPETGTAIAAIAPSVTIAAVQPAAPNTTDSAPESSDTLVAAIPDDASTLMSFEETPDNTSAIGALIVGQGQTLQ